MKDNTVRMKKARAAVTAWCAKKKIALRSPPRHVHPACYVVGLAAPGCLVVAAPWMDSEPQCVDFDRQSPLKTIHLFDASLKAGDWCITAYVQTMGTGEPCAVKIPTGGTHE